MWKRLQPNRAPKQVEVLEDTHQVQSVFDVRSYARNEYRARAAQRQGQLETPTRTGPPPARPPREPLGGYTTLFLHSESQGVNNRVQHRRQPSSLYSQPSPRCDRFSDQTLMPIATYDSGDMEISPPSSPDIKEAYTGPHRDVSISPDISADEDIRPISRMSINTGSARIVNSSIPIAKRGRGTAAEAVALRKAAPDNQMGQKLRPSKDPRWDLYTGEPTTSDRGRPQSVKPKEYAAGQAGSMQLKPVERMPFTTASDPISFNERIRRIKEKNASVLATRPEWKGSSGRQAIVPPVQDQLDMPPLHAPQKYSKKATFPKMDGLMAATPHHEVVANGEVTPILVGQDEKERAIVPESNRNALVPVSSTAEDIAASGYVESEVAVMKPHTRDVIDDRDFPKTLQQAQPQAKPTMTIHAPTSLPPSTSQIGRNFDDAIRTVHIGSRPKESSRWSLSTNNTSTTNSANRPSMDSRPSLESSPAAPIKQPQQAQSSPILMRRRPKNHSITSLQSITRKPLGSEPVVISLANSHTAGNRGPRHSDSDTHRKPLSPRPVSTTSTHKNLPKSPLEISSKDLLSSLQAQVDNLARRRTNLQKSIHQMTELMPRMPAHVPLGSGAGEQRTKVIEQRKLEEEKVEGLKSELADVVREEHDVGIRLHRAWKREGEREVFERSSLWVRRVTG